MRTPHGSAPHPRPVPGRAGRPEPRCSPGGDEGWETRAGREPARAAHAPTAAPLAAGVRNTWCGWKTQMFVSPCTLASVISTK